MAGADDCQQLSPLRDVTTWAASFLRMARLVTGATTAQHGSYESVSTEEEEEDGSDTTRGSVFGVDADESEEQLLADGGEDPRASRASEHILSYSGVHTTNKAHEFMRRPGARAAWRSGDAAVESEPLVLRRAARRANDAETLDHPFGYDRRGRESSSLLLISS